MHTIVVIGGGFSGTLTACHLLRRSDIRVILVESNNQIGRGLAYNALARDFVLNVPAGSMSAWPDRPDDFLAWLQQREPAADALTFASRRLYGEYISDVLGRSSVDAALQIIRDQAVDIERHEGRYSVRLASGGLICCHRVVLALGHAPPRPLSSSNPPAHFTNRIIQNPLVDLKTFAPGTTDTVAIVGTGLTALDIITSLRRGQHRGHIIAISRRGLTPHVHARSTPHAFPPVPDSVRSNPTVRGVIKWLREVGRELSMLQIPPARAVDAMRPYTAELWRRMSTTEKARFCRHASAFWAVSRHRAAPASYTPLRNGFADGSVEILPARYVGFETADPNRVRVDIRPRGQTVSSSLTVDWLVNCTGPDRDLRHQPSTLVQSLLRKRMLQPDPLALGATTTTDGELIDASGDVVSGAYAIGPWRAADLWECTAVPELRVQAAAVAAHVVASLDRECVPVPTEITGPVVTQSP